jgi:hypothetical protein
MANGALGALDRRIDAGAWPLALVDLLALALVFSAGAVHHNGIAFLLSNPVYWLTTLLPFLLGWILVAPLVGAYSPGAAESAKAALPLALRAWIPANVLALLLRYSPLFHGGVQLTFVAVTFVTGAVALLAARWLAFAVR